MMGVRDHHPFLLRAYACYEERLTESSDGLCLQHKVVSFIFYFFVMKNHKKNKISLGLMAQACNSSYLVRKPIEEDISFKASLAT